MFNIPEEKLPSCLKDEQRVAVLFAPFRNINVNPKDRDSKIASWKEIIRIYCDSNNIYSFSLTSLNTVFIRNGRNPSCLNEVIDDMIKNGEVQIQDVFLRKSSESWGGWATDLLIKRPLSWSYNKMNSMFTTTSCDQNCVHLEVIQTKCNNLINSIPEKYKNKLVSLKDLMLIQQETCKIENIKLLLHYLSNQRKIYMTKLGSNGKDKSNTILIKFGTDHNITPISEVDIGIYTLEQNEQSISKTMELLEDEIQQCINDAKKHLSKNHRQMAKSMLRKKHELEKRIEKKAKALENIQILLGRIHETHVDAHVWSAYKNALAAFDTTLKDTGISEDSVDDTMIQLGEILDKHDDIQTALSRPAQEVNDDSDLEAELADLLKGDLDKSDNNTLDKQLEKLTIASPVVPDTSPDVSQQGITLND